MEDKVLAKKIETAIKTTLVIDNKQSIGESHIRINGEPIWFLEGKSGYWDDLIDKHMKNRKRRDKLRILEKES